MRTQTGEFGAVSMVFFLQSLSQMKFLCSLPLLVGFSVPLTPAVPVQCVKSSPVSQTVPTQPGLTLWVMQTFMGLEEHGLEVLVYC